MPTSLPRPCSTGFASGPSTDHSPPWRRSWAWPCPVDSCHSGLPRPAAQRIVVSLPVTEKSRMRPARSCVPLLLTVLGCQAAPLDTTAEAKQAIDAANATWARLTAAGHADSLGQYYHPNAVILPPN